jgi:hypothetical protein
MITSLKRPPRSRLMSLTTMLVSLLGDCNMLTIQVFHVRRRFDWENKYRSTVIDIKSKHLRDALKEVMKDVKAVSLVENEPCVSSHQVAKLFYSL